MLLSSKCPKCRGAIEVTAEEFNCLNCGLTKYRESVNTSSEKEQNEFREIMEESWEKIKAPL